MSNCLSPAQRIHALGRFSGKAGLHRIRALCQALGNPQDRLKFIHIAGTNGKGSTATMLASVLKHAGYQTGLYTSPYLVVFNERIRVNDTMISDRDLSRLFDVVQKAVHTLHLPPNEHIGEFEFVTALAFLYFVEQKCDIVVLETGLGGSYDATNIIAPPEAALITSISLDHTAILGNTLTEIAQTKAGIYKPDSVHIAAYGMTESVYTVLREHAPDLVICKPAQILDAGIWGARFIWCEQEYEIGLAGYHQVSNAVTALTTLQLLSQRGWHIPDAAIHAGLCVARIAGRLEKISTNPCIILDGGHNPDGIRELSNAVKLFHITGKIHVILGMCADKLVSQSVKEFAFPVEQFYLTPLNNERTISTKELASLLPQSSKIVHCQDCADALEQARKKAAPNDFILVCGSLYLVGEARQILCDDKMS